MIGKIENRGKESRDKERTEKKPERTTEGRQMIIIRNTAQNDIYQKNIWLI